MAAARAKVRVMWLAAAIAMLLLGLVGVRVVQVHSETWEWTPTPAAASPRIEFADRSYLRDGVVPSAPHEATAVGRTAGGGVVLSDHWPAPNVPTEVWVEDGGRVVHYTLSGGP
jgi:hypothetical protein